MTETGFLAVRFSYWARYGDRVFGSQVHLLHGHVTEIGSLAVRFSYWARCDDRVSACEVGHVTGTGSLAEVQSSMRISRYLILRIVCNKDLGINIAECTIEATQ